MRIRILAGDLSPNDPDGGFITLLNNSSRRPISVRTIAILILGERESEIVACPSAETFEKGACIETCYVE
jgi:hypothetical protein